MSKENITPKSNARLIDSHQHYWDFARGDYTIKELDEPDCVLLKKYTPKDLTPLLAEAGVDQSVVVQCAQTVEETRFLLDLAKDPSVAGVVGWVPLLDPNAPQIITELAKENAKFKAVRPMLQNLPDDDWIANPALAPGVEALIECGLAFDALVYTRHLSALETFIRRFPRLRIVINHGAKPPIREGVGGKGFQAWADGIRRIAGYPNVLCKYSGLVTEAAGGGGWTDDTLRPYVDHLLGVFGPERLMWGSDWPVVTMNGSYQRWNAAAHALLKGLTEEQRDAVFGGNAISFYRL